MRKGYKRFYNSDNIIDGAPIHTIINTALYDNDAKAIKAFREAVEWWKENDRTIHLDRYIRESNNEFGETEEVGLLDLFKN